MTVIVISYSNTICRVIVLVTITVVRVTVLCNGERQKQYKQSSESHFKRIMMIAVLCSGTLMNNETPT